MRRLALVGTLGAFERTVELRSGRGFGEARDVLAREPGTRVGVPNENKRKRASRLLDSVCLTVADRLGWTEE